MPLLHSPHQCGRAAKRFLCVHVRPGFGKRLDRVGISVTRSQHQHRFARGSLLFCVGSGFQESVRNCRVSIETRQVQRCDAVPGLHVNCRAGSNEQIERLKIVPVHCPMQSCRAIHLGCVHIYLSLKQRANRGFVAIHYGIRQLAPARSKVERGIEQQDYGYAAYEDASDHCPQRIHNCISDENRFQESIWNAG